MDNQMSPDLLSDLPLAIIHIILSFVPVRVAIGTSLLSRQWRYIWSSLPHLTFDENFLDPPIENESDIDVLIRFISQVLLLHEGPIHKFKIHLPLVDLSRVQFQWVNPWLLFLSRNDIRRLVLEFDLDYPGSEVHSSLYSCQKLTHLELRVNTIPPPPPSFKGFLFLRSLFLVSLNGDSSTIESIVAHSPLLEKLTLLGKRDLEMTIRAPNLKIFRDRYGAFYLSLCTPLLEKLMVYSENVEQFSFHESLVFHHLRIIKLYNVHFNRIEATTAVDCLIRRSPNLQELDISTLSSGNDGAMEPACVSFWDTESAPNLTYDSLKVIKMTYFGCGINEMKLVKFLLARSPVLERVIYKSTSPLSEQQLQNLECELLSCRRASANVEIVIEKIREDLLSLIHKFMSL